VARRAPFPRAEGSAAKLQRTSAGRAPLGHRALPPAPAMPPPRATPGLSLLATQRSTAEAQAAAALRPMRPEFAASAPGPTLIRKQPDASLFKRTAQKGAGSKRHGGAGGGGAGGGGQARGAPALQRFAPLSVTRAEPAAASDAPPGALGDRRPTGPADG